MLSENVKKPGIGKRMIESFLIYDGFFLKMKTIERIMSLLFYIYSDDVFIV